MLPYQCMTALYYHMFRDLVSRVPRPAGTVAIISAGTADEQVAEESRATADMMGCYCFRLADVSVDGLHRILHNLPGECAQVCSVHS